MTWLDSAWLFVNGLCQMFQPRANLFYAYTLRTSLTIVPTTLKHAHSKTAPKPAVADNFISVNFLFTASAGYWPIRLQKWTFHWDSALLSVTTTDENYHTIIHPCPAWSVCCFWHLPISPQNCASLVVFSGLNLRGRSFKISLSRDVNNFIFQHRLVGGLPVS